MMKIKKYCQKIRMLCFAASGLLILLTSCKKEVGPEVLRADMSEYAVVGQKAYIDLDRYSCFAIGENVRVNSSTRSITALERNGRQCAINDVPPSADYYAFYPQDLLTNPNNVNLGGGLNGIQVTLPNMQTFRTDANGYQIVDNPMFAVLREANENNYTLHFRNLCALLKLTICTGVAFDAIKVTLNSNQTHYLSGTGTIDYNNNKITISSGIDNVTLALPQGHVGNPLGESFYIMVPEFQIGSNESQATMVIEIMRGTTVVKQYTKNLQVGNAILANHIYQIQPLTFNNTISKVFTVSSDNNTVVFSPGNLQWSYTNGGTDQTTHVINGTGYNNGTWRFAPNQYDIIGDGNVNAIGRDVGPNDWTHIYEDNCVYNGWIDLFAWGGSGYEDSRPYYYTTDNHNNNKCYYLYNNSSLGNYDWGAFNAIYNPKTRNMDPCGTWRVLTKDEWDYLLNTRGENEGWWRYSNVAFNVGTKKIYGLIIYPDGVLTKPSGVASVLEANTTSGYSLITSTDYNALESVGCAFLPCAGRMEHGNGGNQVHCFNPTTGQQSEPGYYWANHAADNTYATCLKVNVGGAKPETYVSERYRNNFISVRLAHDVN